MPAVENDGNIANFRVYFHIWVQGGEVELKPSFPLAVNQKRVDGFEVITRKFYSILPYSIAATSANFT